MTGNFQFGGRVVLVTGAAGGIGAVIAERFLAEGASVVLADINRAVHETAATLGSDATVSVELDVRDRASCAAAIEVAVETFGGLDTLINNAGVTLRKDAVSTSEAEWQAILDLNLTGTVRMCTAAHAHLASSACGVVVNLGSTSGQVAIPGSAAYSVSTAAVLHLTRVLAVEWAVESIRVNAVAPTIVPSPMTADILDNAEFMAAKLATIPMGRMPSCLDVAETVLWLAASESALITGQTVFVDGGVTVS